MVKKVNMIFIRLFPLLMFSCMDDRVVSRVKLRDVLSSLFAMKDFSGKSINNARVYLFDGEITAAGQFGQKIPGVTYGSTRLRKKNQYFYK